MFKNHPKGLLPAALANMGERFGFYTMMAILTLFLMSKFGLDKTNAGLIYSVFYFSIYILAFVGGLIAATIYKVGDILTHYLTEHPEVDSPIHNRAEEYFRQFTELLGEHYKHERSVGFYARQLCITPKYLTTLIKRISGKSVSEWIDNYVILEAKTLLKYSNMSVQEIAYYLNFPNQSFFGSYFKRNTGMSPSQYKAKQ